MWVLCICMTVELHETEEEDASGRDARDGFGLL